MHPDILEATVLGSMPDKNLGEEICAVVVLNDFNEGGVKKITEYCKKYMNRVPKIWVFEDSLPKNKFGEVSKKRLIKELIN
jgi:long-chain acyl-CoA synthetase